jgi:Ran GTPase-activating protein (RanGAP) involved in mRNA processing and transport
VHGGYTLKIEQKLGRAGMEALAPYLRDNARLRTLVLSGAELGNEKDSVEVLAQALKTNTTVTVLDLSKNNLKAEGAKAVVELLARYVRVVVGFQF